MSQDELMLEMLRETQVIATIGFSTNAHKPSHYVPRYLIEQGYQVIPIHPSAKDILGQKAYPVLTQVAEKVDLVQLFRPSDQVAPHVDEAIEKGVSHIWMQLGIRNDQAAKKARQAGIKVIQDRCMLVEHRRLKSRI